MSSRPRALVTGAGIRLGRAMAVALAQDGFDLVLHYRSSQNQVQVTAQMCAAHGASSQIVQGDLSQVEACCSVALTAGAVDVLVNSAALYSAVLGYNKGTTHLSDRPWEPFQEHVSKFHRPIRKTSCYANCENTMCEGTGTSYTRGLRQLS